MSKTCPKCGSDETRRIKRPFWMRMFRNSICIYCYRCARRSMLRS